MRGSATRKAIGDAARTWAPVIVDLASRAFEVAVMIEFLEPSKHLLAAASHKVGDLV
jgi:hypothetical protein